MRRVFLLVGLLGLVGLGPVGVAGPPNIVWIIADDMSPDTAGYGVAGVSTPNLDRLAREGRRFDRCYATAPVCSSSRSAFILGCYQTTTGLHPHEVQNPQPLPAPYLPLPTLLKRAGWFVTNAAAPGSHQSGRPIRGGKTHYNFAHDAGELFDGDDWRKRTRGQPFFAQYQIREPHRPFPIPASFSAAEIDAVALPANYPDHPLTRRDWVAYLRSVEMVDRRVGAILDQLEAEGVLDQTVVMFFADHGRPMPWGKQWLSVEGLRVPLIVRGPGVAAGAEPGVVSLVDLAPTVLALGGRAIPDWMEGESILGRSLPADRAVFAARDRCGDAMDRSRAVITATAMLVKNFFPERSRLNWSSYKEAAYPGLPLVRQLAARGQLTPLQSAWLGQTRATVELYDLRADPAGLLDVAREPDRADQVARLMSKLDEWIESTGDRGGGGDPATEPPLAEIQKRKRASYGRTWKQRLGIEDPTDAERVDWWLREYRLAE
jgi:N-sulfoglucosamine sulfohydrolase